MRGPHNVPVPPTNALVAQIFGVRYLAMLSGFSFFSPQV